LSHNQSPRLSDRQSNTQRAQYLPYKIDWFILLFLIFIPRLLNLDVFLTVDEPLFLDHARKFADGLASGDFSQTLGIGYPGVTVAWWAAPVVGLAQTELGAYVAGRFVTVLVNGLLLLVMYSLARSLLGRWPALLGVGLLALDPYVMAYSRLLHIEAPLAFFMTLAGLTFLLWLRDTRWRWLLLTGLFTGLALLTKSTALLLGPMLVAMLTGWTLISTKQPIEEVASRFTFYVSRFTFYATLQKLTGLLVIALLAAAVFFILWPAMWVDPIQALNLTFGKLLTDQEAGIGNYGMFWLDQFVQDPGPLFYWVTFLLKATPWLLVGLGLSFIQNFKRINVKHSNVILPLWLFALTYLIIMSIASKKSVRYLLPAFPTFYLLAGLALYQFSKSANKRISKWRTHRAAKPVANGETSRFSAKPPLGTLHASERSLPLGRFTPPHLLLFHPLILFTLFYHPYYFTYYNPLLLGWLWAPRTLLVGWGEGLDEAARYLNHQPQGMVAAWYEWIFPILYQGEVQDTTVENLIKADYTVLYINQVQRDVPNPNIIDYFRTRRKPEYTVRLAGIEYAWVYPGPVIGFRPDPTLSYPLGGDFGGEVRLLGYDLSQPQLSGQPLIVTLYWQVLATPLADRFVYVRLVDAQGRIWAKADSPPVMGLWPNSDWQPGMLVEDAQELSIPPGTPPGTYRLEVGWYNPATGQTLNASGQPLGQGGGLLLGEVQLGWQALSAEPDLPQQTDTRLAPNAHLVGFEVPPTTATTGDLLPIRLAWREAHSLLNFAAVPNNFVMFEWRQADQSLPAPDRVAEQLDPLPLPIEEWGRNALLLSQHDVIVPPTLAVGRYDLVVMLHTSSDPAGEAFSLGSVEVTSPPHQFDLPPAASVPANPAQLDQGITLAGYEVQPTVQVLNLNLYWQTQMPLTTRYKVFAQLLTADNTLVAQSDSFPATGQRPTTGWLPQEIIVDPHTLTFSSKPAPGTYRLIAGLYNPLTGQRLPVVDERGEIVSDAILVTEVTLP
jgi:hypothetical protein